MNITEAHEVLEQHGIEYVPTSHSAFVKAVAEKIVELDLAAGVASMGQDVSLSVAFNARELKDGDVLLFKVDDLDAGTISNIKAHLTKLSNGAKITILGMNHGDEVCLNQSPV